MFSQFFGNYLLNRKLVTPAQLSSGIQEVQNLHTKIGELAIRYGYLTNEQVEKIHICQTHEDKRFGEIAVEHGLITKEDFEKLLSTQNNDYEILCKILVDNGTLTPETCKDALTDFKEKYRLEEFENISLLQSTKINILINNFYKLSGLSNPEMFIKLLTLLFNNITRFIGRDFTPYIEYTLTEPINGSYISQNITGAFTAHTAITGETDALIEFASRYAETEFDCIDEYVIASLQDFLNLHNGLFTVNISNQNGLELSLTPPVVSEGHALDENTTIYCIPIGFPFGTINFIISDV